MILTDDKQDQEQQQFTDLPPPAYADAVQSSSGSTQASSRPWGTESKRQPPQEGASPNAIASSSSHSVPSNSAGAGGLAAWFSFGALSRTDKEVKATVLGLVRDVVKQTPGPAGIAIFQSCAEACRTRNIRFDVLLQEKSIEGHTPLYWAILKRSRTEELGLLDLLLSFPLTEETRSDAANACMLQSDNELFQKLQHSPGWKQTARTGTEEMLLGSSPEDSVLVKNLEGDNGAFQAEFYVPEFQQRMRVSRNVQIEFIARERLWVVTFSRDYLTGNRRRGKRVKWTEPSAAGYVGITILDESNSTPFAGRIVIENVKNPNKSPLTIPLKAREPLRPARWSGDTVGVCSVDLASTSDGASLQHTGSSYIDSENGLRFKLEAKLTSDDPDCVIM